MKEKSHRSVPPDRLTAGDFDRIENYEMPKLDEVEIDDHLRLVLNSIPNVPSLSVEESARLANQVQSGRRADGSLNESAIEARNIMMFSCKGMAMKMAIRYNFTSDTPLDLFQIGFIGLQEAAERFDSSYGCKFSTYAFWVCRRAIQGEMRKNQKHDVVDSLSDSTVLRKTREGDDVNDGADLLGDIMYENALEQDEPEQTSPEGEVIGLMQKRIEEQIKIVEKDEPRQAEVLRLRLGINGEGKWEKGLNQREIARLFRRSGVRISQLQTQAMRKIKDREVHAVLMELLFPRKSPWD